jgi:hypothetical protein
MNEIVVTPEPESNDGVDEIPLVNISQSDCAFNPERPTTQRNETKMIIKYLMIFNFMDFFKLREYDYYSRNVSSIKD